MKVLFVTRKYPPSKGGMEQISYGVITNFPELNKARVISWGYTQKGLLVFIPWVFLKSSYLLAFKKADIVHLGDFALSFLGVFLKKVFRVPIVVTVHGLDLTFKNRLYQWMVGKTIRQMDQIICVSSASKDVAVIKGADPKKCIVVHNGINTSEWIMVGNKDKLRSELGSKVGMGLKGKFLIFSVGRLVERKGIHWFVKEVLPKLEEDFIFLVMGSGEYENKIRDATVSSGVKDRVLMLGRAPDDIKRLAYNASDVFIMPNIPVEGDMEGFGIVAIEAASCGLPVIASNLEGIKDAIKDGENGFLVEPYDAEGFVKEINKVTNMKKISDFKKKQIRYTCKNYDLKNISYEYYSLFKKVLER